MLNAWQTALRGLFLGCGAASALWGISIAPTFWQESSVIRTANYISDGHILKLRELVDFIPVADAVAQQSLCRSSVLQGAAIIRLRIVEEAFARGQRELLDSPINDLGKVVRRSLACSPSDPYLWIVLFWSESAQSGFRLDDLPYLRLSYQLGPNEGWIAVKRSQIAFSIFEQLTPDLKEAVLEEFKNLLQTGFIDETVGIFVSPGWRVRDQILQRIRDVDERHRQAFARALYRQGYDVEVPGIERTVARPWRF